MEHNVAYKEIAEPIRPRGHEAGTCGGMNGLCTECEALELGWHLQVAERIARETPALPEETPGHYWRRVGGRFVDTWWVAACHATRGVAA